MESAQGMFPHFSRIRYVVLLQKFFKRWNLFCVIDIFFTTAHNIFNIVNPSTCIKSCALQLDNKIVKKVNYILMYFITYDSWTTVDSIVLRVVFLNDPIVVIFCKVSTKSFFQSFFFY